jgi:hypothetical protein
VPRIHHCYLLDQFDDALSPAEETADDEIPSYVRASALCIVPDRPPQRDPVKAL